MSGGRVDAEDGQEYESPSLDPREQEADILEYQLIVAAARELFEETSIDIRHNVTRLRPKFEVNNKWFFELELKDKDFEAINDIAQQGR